MKIPMKEAIKKIMRKAKAPAKRSFEGARLTRLENDWIAGQTSIDYDMRWQLKILINRARSFEQNNEYAAGFLRLMENNVLGSNPFVLQMKVKEPTGAHDKVAEQIIEREWKKWSQPANCTIMGNMSMCDVYRVSLRSLLRDGALLVRKHKGGKYGMQLEPIDIDYLDPDYNDELANGNRIRMSVETNESGRPVAYWLLGDHPGDVLFQGRNMTRTRVPASQIIHGFFQTRANQSRGYPVFAPAMLQSRNLAGFREATIVNARASAAKMGFFEKTPGEVGGYGGDSAPGGKYMDAEAGSLEELPVGLKFTAWDPKQPTTGYADFVRECLRGMATALGVSYMTFANDPGDANYSSARIGMLEEREGYKSLQRWMIDHFCIPIFEDWLFASLSRQQLDFLPVSKYEKFNMPFFQGRRWQWVDPEKEAKGYREAIEIGITSPARVIGELGDDEEEVLDEIRQTMDERARLGLHSTEKLAAIARGNADTKKEGSPMIDSLGAVGSQALSALLGQAASGGITADALEQLLVSVYGFEPGAAKKIAQGIVPAA